MGYLTLQQFRDSLNLSLGPNRQTGNERLDAWINLAYFETASETEFEGLKMSATAVTVASQASYSLPDDLMSIISVADLTNDRRLVKLGLHNYHLKDRNVEGDPRYYARRKRVMYLWPTPDAVFNLEVYYLEEICPMELASDVTVFPQSYDAVVLRKAKKFAWEDLGNEQKANYYEAQSQRSMSRLPSDTEEADEITAPLTVARSLSDITEMETDVPE